jgi:hypothetical protein
MPHSLFTSWFRLLKALGSMAHGKRVGLPNSAIVQQRTIPLQPNEPVKPLLPVLSIPIFWSKNANTRDDVAAGLGTNFEHPHPATTADPMLAECRNPAQGDILKRGNKF